MQHIINKQVIELSIRSGTDAFGVQQRVSTDFYQRIMPILQKVFDDLSTAEEVICFDRLDIDLGAVTAEDIGQGEWTEGLYAKLMDRAETLIRQGLSRRNPLHRTAGANIFAQWLLYMQNGYLPWNLLRIDEAWLDNLLRHLASDYASVQSLRKQLSAHPLVVNRIVAQHHERFLVSLVELLTAQNQAQLPAAIRELTMLADRKSDPGPIRPVILRTDANTNMATRVWIRILGIAADTTTVHDTMNIMRILLADLPLATTNLIAIEQELTQSLPICGPILAEILSLSPTGLSATKQHPQRGPATHDDTSKPSPPSLPTRVQSGELAIATRDRQLEREGIFVSHAGVVLLHPFLPAFFTRLGLLDAGKFKDPASQTKALYLLHYLATGQAGAAEYELVVAKILCAFPPEWTVAMDGAISEAEAEESMELLAACIQQWSAIKNTSVTGLREAFLQRSGKLFSKNGKMQLEVEKTAIDVLLDYLPWNLSLVKLPWMEAMLFVSWR